MQTITHLPMKTEQLSHLGLVSSTIKQMGLIDKINQRLPLDKKKGRENRSWLPCSSDDNQWAGLSDSDFIFVSPLF